MRIADDRMRADCLSNGEIERGYRVLDVEIVREISCRSRATTFVLVALIDPGTGGPSFTRTVLLARYSSGVARFFVRDAHADELAAGIVEAEKRSTELALELQPLTRMAP